MDEENRKPQENNSKDRLKALESDIKQAFKEDLFEDVKKLATEIKSLDPENHLARKLIEKIAAAKAKADAKAKESKVVG